MSLRINQNIEALTANRYLAQNDAMLSKSIEKLASGQKKLTQLPMVRLL